MRTLITWFQVWPLLLMPYIISFAVGLFPYVREFALNNLLIPLLPYGLAVNLVDWYRTASVLEELSLHFIISVNIGTLVYPLFYLIGHCFIALTNNIARSQITSLNQR